MTDKEKRDFGNCYITGLKTENGETGRFFIVGDKVNLLNLINSWVSFHEQYPGKISGDEIKFSTKLLNFLKQD